MAEQSGESLMPDEIRSSRVGKDGIIKKTISPINPDGEVGTGLEQNLVPGYDSKANPTEKLIPDNNLHTTGENVDKKA